MQKPRHQKRGRWRDGTLTAVRAVSRLSSENRRALSLALVGLALFGTAAWAMAAAPAVRADDLHLAQNTGTALSVPEIRECLCMEQQMGMGRENLDLRQDMLNERQQELANIDQQVQEQRNALSPNDTVGQQVLKDLMTQQQALREMVQNDLRPAYNTQVTALNDLVAKYNGQCVNRQRYTMDVKTAQQDLQCPKPE